MAKFIMAEFEIHCSTGTYVRSLSQQMGQTTGLGALAYDILRTKVGNYSLESGASGS